MHGKGIFVLADSICFSCYCGDQKSFQRFKISSIGMQAFHKILNKQINFRFWICQGSQYATIVNIDMGGLHGVLNMPE